MNAPALAPRSWRALWLAVGIGLALARATTVIPPTWPELVQEADAIYRGTVTAVAARRVAAPDGSNVVKTYVTLAIDRTLKGPARAELVLEFLGGTADGLKLLVSGMPRFVVGATDYVFVQRNGVQFCPLVAMKHGRYRVQRDVATSREWVTRDNGTPLADLAQVALPMNALPAPVAAAAAATSRDTSLTAGAFETAILGEVQRASSGLRAN
jgi:hypothetical protein